MDVWVKMQWLPSRRLHVPGCPSPAARCTCLVRVEVK